MDIKPDFNNEDRNFINDAIITLQRGRKKRGDFMESGCLRVERDRLQSSGESSFGIHRRVATIKVKEKC